MTSPWYPITPDPIYALEPRPLDAPHRIIETPPPEAIPGDPNRRFLLGTIGPQGFSAVLPAVILGPPVTGTQAVELVSWRDPADAPRNVVIHLSATKANSGSNIRHRAFATLLWGHGGARYQADVDLLRGVSISLVASFVMISATNESEGVVIDPTGAGRIPVTGMICPEGDLSTVLEPRRSFADNNTGVAGTTFAIPPFAMSLDVLSAGDPVTNITFRQDGGVNIGSVSIPIGSSFTRRPIPVPNDATDVVVDHPAGAARTEVIFYLSI